MFDSTIARIDDAFVVTDQPARPDVDFLEARLDEHNQSHTGITDARALAIVVRDDRANVVAGLYGWTWGACCEVDKLWVHEQWRRRDVGTRLMQAAETEARARGATQIVLSTHSFQAPAFYHRLGFVEVGRVDGYPRGHSNIYLRKLLTSG